MLDEIRDHLTSFLSRNHTCVISTNGLTGVWAALAQYENDGLILKCRLPRWLDSTYYLEQEPHVVAIILDAQSDRRLWLHYRGVAEVMVSDDNRSAAVHIKPERLDLIDESRGWGSRETLDL